MKDWAHDVGETGYPLLLTLRYDRNAAALGRLFTALEALSPEYYRWHFSGIPEHGAFLHRLGGRALERWYRNKLPGAAQDGTSPAFVEHGDLFYVTFTPTTCQFGRDCGDFVPVEGDRQILTQILESELNIQHWSLVDGDYGTVFAQADTALELRHYLAD